MWMNLNGRGLMRKPKHNFRIASVDRKFLAVDHCMFAFKNLLNFGTFENAYFT